MLYSAQLLRTKAALKLTVVGGTCNPCVWEGGKNRSILVNLGALGLHNKYRTSQGYRRETYLNMPTVSKEIINK